MSIVTGRAILRSSSGRSPWSNLFAHGQALVADEMNAIDTLEELDRRCQSTLHAGFFNYDLGRCFEELPSLAIDDGRLPSMAFVPVDLGSPPTEDLKPWQISSQTIASTFSESAYRAAVVRCLDYIAAGDVFQVNLSQRFSVPTNEPPNAIFERLQQSYPAEFGAFFDFGTFQLLSNSPELFLRVARTNDGRRKIINRPIKGTRPNAPGMADALRDSAKDRAELAMIVDLQRNDLGRICEFGTVVVTDARSIEAHPTVLHGVATIEGILRDDVTLVDILRATFPCGSVTGCPKIRAMEIIEELEPVRRGAYCGAIGWIGGGEMELAVAIRTVTMQDGMAYVSAGGGIVADSDPAEEYAETLVKARAMLSALGVQLAL